MPTITRRGDSFFAQVRIKKGKTIVFSESKTFPTKETAKSWATKLEALVKGEKNPLPSMTVGQLIEKHLEYQQKLRPLGRATIFNHMQTAQAFKGINLRDLTAKHITDFVVQRKAEGAGPATILGNLSPLSAAIHAAPYAHDIHADPTEVDLAIKKLKQAGAIRKSRQVIRLVEPEEEAALMAEFERRNLHHQTAIDMVLVYKMAIALPRRASDLTRIRWADVDHKRKTILIRDVKHPQHKIGNDQVVPLIGEAYALLEQIPKLDERIFPYNTESMLAAFERARDRIAATGMPQIEDLRFHDLRHSGITRLFQAGLKIEEVATISGHTNWAQLKRYTHIAPEDVHSRWAKLSTANVQPAAEKPAAPKPRAKRQVSAPAHEDQLSLFG